MAGNKAIPSEQYTRPKKQEADKENEERKTNSRTITIGPRWACYVNRLQVTMSCHCDAS